MWKSGGMWKRCGKVWELSILSFEFLVRGLGVEKGGLALIQVRDR